MYCGARGRFFPVATSAAPPFLNLGDPLCRAVKPALSPFRHSRHHCFDCHFHFMSCCLSKWIMFGQCCHLFPSTLWEKRQSGILGEANICEFVQTCILAARASKWQTHNTRPRKGDKHKTQHNILQRETNTTPTQHRTIHKSTKTHNTSWRDTNTTPPTISPLDGCHCPMSVTAPEP